MSNFRVLLLLAGLLVAWIWFQKDQFIDPISGVPLFSESADESLVDSRTTAPREVGASALPDSNLVGTRHLDGLKRTLKEWTQCYHQGSCDESGTLASEELRGVAAESIEPLEETMAARDHVINSFRSLAAGLNEAGDFAGLESLVREYLSFPNDYVKESAVQWLDRLPMSSENLNSLLQGLEASSSQPLQEAALTHIHKYYEAGYQTEVTDHLIRQIRHGGHFVSQFLARQSGDFLANENIQKFEDLLRTVNPGSHVHQLLDAQIREFRRAQAPSEATSNE